MVTAVFVACRFNVNRFLSKTADIRKEKGNLQHLPHMSLRRSLISLGLSTSGAIFATDRNHRSRSALSAGVAAPDKPPRLLGRPRGPGRGGPSDEPRQRPASRWSSGAQIFFSAKTAALSAVASQHGNPVETKKWTASRPHETSTNFVEELLVPLVVYLTASGGDTLGWCMVLKLIFVWLALQVPLGALIGTFIQNGATQPRRRKACAGAVPAAKLSPVLAP
jgi:hypothetical protein